MGSVFENTMKVGIILSSLCKHGKYAPTNALVDTMQEVKKAREYIITIFIEEHKRLSSNKTEMDTKGPVNFTYLAQISNVSTGIPHAQQEAKTKK